MKEPVKKWHNVIIELADEEDSTEAVDIAFQLLKEMHRNNNCLSHMWIKNRLTVKAHRQIRTMDIFYQEILVPNLSEHNASILQDFGYEVQYTNGIIGHIYTNKKDRKKNYTKILL